MADILGYAALADQLRLDVFAVGEHHSAEFFTSSPAVVLAAAAARTTAIRLQRDDPPRSGRPGPATQRPVP